MEKDEEGKREGKEGGGEMTGWDEDELVGSQRMINGREKR
jgi:hypothetical protein